LISVVVLRQGAEHYKNLCREKRFVVRPFKFDPAEDKAEKERKDQLATKKKKLWVRLARLQFVAADLADSRLLLSRACMLMYVLCSCCLVLSLLLHVA